MKKESYKIKERIGKWVFLIKWGTTIAGFDCAQVTNIFCENINEIEENSKCVVTLANNDYFIIETTLDELIKLLQLN